jgi:hypothetical protein
MFTAAAMFVHMSTTKLPKEKLSTVILPNILKTAKWYYINDANPDVPNAKVPNVRVPNMEIRQRAKTSLCRCYKVHNRQSIDFLM